MVYQHNKEIQVTVTWQDKKEYFEELGKAAPKMYKLLQEYVDMVLNSSTCTIYDCEQFAYKVQELLDELSYERFKS